MMVDAASNDLQRFVIAQDAVYAQVTSELQRGRKTSHWMWFIFPQLRGLGVSSMATFYGLASASEALGYWRHPTLGARLRVCTELVLAVEGKTAHEIFGSPDDMKLRSCMTLFAAVVEDEPIFGQVLTRFFNGQPDDRSLKALARH
jgi:uncharacterized protein (DUF1810 family)